MIAGGSLAYNETIPAGTSINVQGTVTVPSGKTLTIGAGCNLTFLNDCSLNIYGTLNSPGTALSKITYDFVEPVSKKQNGIRIYTAAFTINNSIIKRAANGIYINNASPNISNSISNCIIQNNNYGLNIQNTNYITLNILDNEIKSNYYGIYLYSSSPKIRDNEIYSNVTAGIYCSNFASPSLGQLGLYGNNILRNNTKGLIANISSNPFLGEQDAGISGGYNQFYSNSLLNIQATSNCYILAQENWWGSYPPDVNKFSADGTSTIDYSYPLHSAPEPMVMVNKSSVEDNDKETVKVLVRVGVPETEYGEIIYDHKWHIQKKLAFARNMIYLDKISFAQRICKNVIRENTYIFCSFRLSLLLIYIIFTFILL